MDDETAAGPMHIADWHRTLRSCQHCGRWRRLRPPGVLFNQWRAPQMVGCKHVRQEAGGGGFSIRERKRCDCGWREAIAGARGLAQFAKHCTELTLAPRARVRAVDALAMRKTTRAGRARAMRRSSVSSNIDIANVVITVVIAIIATAHVTVRDIFVVDVRGLPDSVDNLDSNARAPSMNNTRLNTDANANGPKIHVYIKVHQPPSLCPPPPRTPPPPAPQAIAQIVWRCRGRRRGRKNGSRSSQLEPRRR